MVTIHDMSVRPVAFYVTAGYLPPLKKLYVLERTSRSVLHKVAIKDIMVRDRKVELAKDIYSRYGGETLYGDAHGFQCTVDGRRFNSDVVCPDLQDGFGALKSHVQLLQYLKRSSTLMASMDHSTRVSRVIASIQCVLSRAYFVVVD